MSEPVMNETRKRSLRHPVSCAVPAILFLALLTLFSVSNSPASTLTESEPVAVTEHFSLTAKIEYLFKSHTSYEFGNPFWPYQAPLSQLEFPLDSWWGGLEMRLSFPRFSVGLEALTNISQNAHGNMEDSDWDDDARIDEKTIYSQSQMRVGPSYMIKGDADLEVSDWLGLPNWLSIRPLVGMRWQKFNLVAHDGIQYAYTNGSSPSILSGESLRFKQTYWHYFTGIRGAVDLSGLTGISSLRLVSQFDWAYVEGMNEDNHLLRAGRRFTYEDTYGEAWHGMIGLRKDLWKNLTLGLDLDHLTISTTGNHRLLNRTMGLDMSFSNGVKVWSDQTSVSLTLKCRW